MQKPWTECSPAEQEQRRVNFGHRDSQLDARNARAAELVRRYHAGEPLSKADAREARSLVAEQARQS